MKKILITAIAAFAVVAPQSASAELAPLCGSTEPVAVGVRCASGNTFCQVYVRVSDNDVIDRQRVCV